MAALVLLSHGAKTAEWRENMEALQREVFKQNPAQKTRLAFLNLMAPSLNDALTELIVENETAITIAPIFIGTGGHIARDIAEIVASFQNQHPNVAFNLLPPLGTQPLVLSAMAAVALQSL